jgi:hypothetical protein
VVWNCADDDLPYADREVSDLQSLGSADCDVVVAGRSLEWDGLALLVASVKPTIFHFIGHGDVSGEINVREHGAHVGRPATEVIRVVQAASANLEGVYLSGCFTARNGPELLTNLSPAAGWAIGTTSEVDDELAMQFSKTFYQHLIGARSTPREAFQVARAYVEPEWGVEHSHAAWFASSHLPPADFMARTIVDGLRGIFSRPAFTDSMKRETSMRDLETALKDVSHALGTGQVLSRRDRTPIPSVSFPADWLQHADIQRFVLAARRGLNATQRALNVLTSGVQGQDFVIGNALNFDTSVTTDEWMNRINKVDRARNQILKAANALLVRNDLTPLPLIPQSYGQADMHLVRRHIGVH